MAEVLQALRARPRCYNPSAKNYITLRLPGPSAVAGSWLCVVVSRLLSLARVRVDSHSTLVSGRGPEYSVTRTQLPATPFGAFLRRLLDPDAFG